jgi:hypothetical protein
MEAIEEPTGDEVEAGAEELVLGWRVEELVAAGYEAGDALLFAAHTEVDLHLAADLPRRGCPHKTALHILL